MSEKGWVRSTMTPSERGLYDSALNLCREIDLAGPDDPGLASSLGLVSDAVAVLQEAVLAEEIAELLQFHGVLLALAA